ncbi:MAG TPA: UvrD-helicase domain-containing protein, partial [Conexibacter sp.]
MPKNYRLPPALTPAQRAVVTHGDGPLRIFAGPGSGKTFALTHRIAHLLATSTATAQEVLAVTFTVKAAAEMKLRLLNLIGNEAVDGLTVRTFHSVCGQMVRSHAAVFGRDERFTIYDQHEVRRLVEARISEPATPMLKAALQRHGAPPPAEIVGEISLGKSRLLDVDAYEMLGRHPATDVIAAVWHELNVELRASNAVDFDDLLCFAVRLLESHPQVVERVRRRWRHVLVDEYQDTNVAQAQWLRIITGSAGNVAVVGDDDQSLYGWRAADVDNILHFERQYPRHRTITLEENFRSRSEILSAASRLIGHNESRHLKELVAVRGSGGSVQLARFADDEAEADWIAETIAWFVNHGVDAGEILVMLRSVGQRGRYFRPLAASLGARAIPYRIVGTLGLYERREVRAALGYIALLVNPHDAAAFARAIGFPARGCGPKTTAVVVRWAREQGHDLLAACTLAAAIPTTGARRARNALESFGTEMIRLRSLLGTRSLVRVVTEALMGPGPVRHLEGRRDAARSAADREDAERVLEDLRSLVAAVSSFERNAEDPTAASFLAEAAGVEQTQPADA